MTKISKERAPAKECALSGNTNRPLNYTQPVADIEYNPEFIRADQIAEARQRVADENRDKSKRAVNLRNRLDKLGKLDTVLAQAFHKAFGKAPR